MSDILSNTFIPERCNGVRAFGEAFLRCHK
jgi:hypothetical protein